MSRFVVFTPDDDYDLTHASDRESRYGAYLRRNLVAFLDADDKPTSSPLEFAAGAWRTATSPVMSPGYVTAHPRVLDSAAVSDLAGRLAVSVEVATDLPRGNAHGLRGAWSGWQRGHHWFAPSTYERPSATALLQLRVPIAAEGLPEPIYTATAEPDTDTAKHTVAVLCARLNAALAGVFTHLVEKEAV